MAGRTMGLVGTAGWMLELVGGTVGAWCRWDIGAIEGVEL